MDDIFTRIVLKEADLMNFSLAKFDLQRMPSYPSKVYYVDIQK